MVRPCGPAAVEWDSRPAPAGDTHPALPCLPGSPALPSDTKSHNPTFIGYHSPGRLSSEKRKYARGDFQNRNAWVAHALPFIYAPLASARRVGAHT